MATYFMSDYDKEQYANDQNMKKYQDNSDINVKQSPFNAKGDGVTDDTAAIQTAINYAIANNIKVVYFPYGVYLFSNLTITSDVTLKMDWQYNLYLPYDGDPLSNYKLMRIAGSTGYGIDGTGGHPNFVNMQIDGNSVSGYCVYNVDRGKNINIYNADTGLALARSAVIEDLYITRCLTSGMVLLSGDGTYNGNADSQFLTFNIWNNIGHGIIFNGGGNTCRFENGKVEWNYMDNIHVQAWTNEVHWVNCNLDSANWFNLFVDTSGSCDYWHFTGSYCRGGRNRLSGSDTYGHNYPDMSILLPAYNSDLCQIRIAGWAHLTFTGCYFRAQNNSNQSTDVTSVVINNSASTTSIVNMNGCWANDFTHANLAINCPSTIISNTTHSDMIYSQVPYDSGKHYNLITHNSQELISLISNLPNTFTFLDWTSHKTITKYGTKFYDASGTQALLNVYDTFSGKDSSSTMGAAGSSQNWVVQTGAGGTGSSTWGAATSAGSSYAYIVTPGTGNSLAVIDSSLSDCKVSVTLKNITGNPCLAFRASGTDNQNFWYIKANANYELHKVTAGVDSAQQTYSSPVPANNHYIKVILSSANITFQINNTNVGTVTTDVFNQTATKHGISGTSSNSRWGNFITDAE